VTGRALNTFAALVRRDFLIARSYRGALGLETLLGLLGVAVYYFISETFEGARSADLGPAPTYFAFALVGVVLAVVIQTAAVSVSRRIREEQLTGTLEAIVTQPVGNAELALGMACYPFAFAAVRAVVYIAVAGLIADVDFGRADWLGAAVTLTATAVAIGAIGIALGAVVLLIKRAEVLTGTIVFLMSFAGGAYFPVSELPGVVRAVSEALPTRLAFDGLRSALYEGSGWGDEVVVLLAMGVVGMPLAVWVFGRALALAKSRALLTEY
jgi:ABC-2 type transport system permease protein